MAVKVIIGKKGENYAKTSQCFVVCFNIAGIAGYACDGATYLYVPDAGNWGTQTIQNEISADTWDSAVVFINKAGVIVGENSLFDNNKAGVGGAVALSSVAISNVRRGEVSVGAGYGYFNGQSVGAFGAAMGLSNRWSINAGAGVSGYDVAFRAGTNYKFRLFK